MIGDLATTALHLLPAETAHRIALQSLAWGLVPRARSEDDPRLASRVFGLDFPNPIGLAAGFDKNAEAPDALLALGFGFVETGTVTPRPQAGNSRPRLFRLPFDRAIVNRLGFNGEGLERVAARLGRAPRHGVVGVNLGKNRDTADAAADYVEGVRRLGPLASYLVINVSSPNTPGLRALQARSEASRLIEAAAAARDTLSSGHRPPLLLKIAPDLSELEIADLAEVARNSPLDGMIVSNTTTARPPTLRSPSAHEPGGLSGQPLFERSTALLATLHRLTDGKLPLIGVGGVASGEQAYRKFRAGASLVQIYTGFIYEGPGLIGRIKRELLELLERDGFPTLVAAIGTGAIQPPHKVRRQGAGSDGP